MCAVRLGGAAEELLQSSLNVQNAFCMRSEFLRIGCYEGFYLLGCEVIGVIGR